MTKNKMAERRLKVIDDLFSVTKGKFRKARTKEDYVERKIHLRDRTTS